MDILQFSFINLIDLLFVLIILYTMFIWLVIIQAYCAFFHIIYNLLQVMADTKFLNKLQDYQKDTINAEICDLLLPYLQFPQYTFEAAKIACGNVAGLLSWTIAMASFFEVNREVLPLKVILFIKKAILGFVNAYTYRQILLFNKSNLRELKMSIPKLWIFSKLKKMR